MTDRIKYKAPYDLTKGHDTDSGYDVRSTGEYRINNLETVKIPTGISVELPNDYEVQVRPRSGLSSKGILVYFGTVDSGYRGEIMVNVTNINNREYTELMDPVRGIGMRAYGEPITIEKGEKIAQLVFVKKTELPLKKVDMINTSTSRGSNGFGSTGRF